MEHDKEILEILHKKLDGYPGVNYDDLLNIARDIALDGHDVNEAAAEAAEFYFDEVMEL